MEKKRSTGHGKTRQKATTTGPKPSAPDRDLSTRNRDESLEGMQEPARSRSEDRSVRESAEFNARVARKAFELFERRGSTGGSDLDDWLKAEQMVKEEIRRENQAAR